MNTAASLLLYSNYMDWNFSWKEMYHWSHQRGSWGAVDEVPVLWETSPRRPHRSCVSPLRCLKKHSAQFLQLWNQSGHFNGQWWEDEARKNNVSYLVLGPSPDHGNKTSSLGSSPADDGRPLLPPLDVPTSTTTLLQKHDHKYITCQKLLRFNRQAKNELLVIFN